MEKTEPIMFIESTAASSDSIFYHKQLIQEMEKRIFDECCIIWPDAPEYHATGMPDFLPESGK